MDPWSSRFQSKAIRFLVEHVFLVGMPDPLEWGFFPEMASDVPSPKIYISKNSSLLGDSPLLLHAVLAMLIKADSIAYAS